MNARSLSGEDLMTLLRNGIFAHVHNRAIEGGVVKIARTTDGGLSVATAQGGWDAFETYEDAARHANQVLRIPLPRPRRLTDLQYKALEMADAGRNPGAVWTSLNRQAGWSAVVRSLYASGLMGRTAKDHSPAITAHGRQVLADERALRAGTA